MKHLAFLTLIALTAACGHMGGLKATVESDEGYKAVFAPSVQIMPRISPEMNTAGFWLNKTSTPDRVIMTPEEISQFNKHAETQHYLPSIADYAPELDGKTLKNSIDTLYQAMLSRPLYDRQGEKIKPGSFEALYALTGAADILENGVYPVSKALIVRYTDHLNLPTEQYLLRQGDYGDFNRLQMSSLDVGTPVAVLFTSTDGQWHYVRSKLTVGWVPTDTVAFCTDEEIARWENMENFVLTVQAKTSVYSTDGLMGFRGWLPMGVKLPVYETSHRDDSAVTTVIWPYRTDEGWLAHATGYIENQNIHRGYMPYTSRTMLSLAFRMLNSPYGWGGMHGEQDCSGLLIRIFNTVGLTMPRNSSQQGSVGSALYQRAPEDEAEDIRPILVSGGIPGATLVQFPGHIMLYIGHVAEEPYVLHAIWSFEEILGGKFIARRIPARVVVSSLALSAHMEKGPYYKRITNIRNYE